MIQSTTDIINVNVIGATYVVTLLIGVAGIPALTGEVNSIYPLPGEMVVLYLTYMYSSLLEHITSFMWLLIKKPVCSDSLSVWFLSLCLFFPRYNTSPNTSETGREMMKQKPILSCWMIFILLLPPFLPVMHTSGTGSLQTTIESDSGVFVDQTTLHVKNHTNLTFTIEVQSATMSHGEYSYSGVISGDGNYSNNSIIPLATNLSGVVNLTYRALGSANESNKTLRIVFDNIQPSLTFSAISKTIFSYNSTSPIPEEIIISPTGSFRIACQDLTNDISNISISSSNSTPLAFTTNATNLNMQGSAFVNQSSSAFSVHCTDMVGNIYTDHVEVVVDNTPPVLAINYNSPITTDCLPPSWQTSASASDTTPPVSPFTDSTIQPLGTTCPPHSGQP